MFWSFFGVLLIVVSACGGNEPAPTPMPSTTPTHSATQTPTKEASPTQRPTTSLPTLPLSTRVPPNSYDNGQVACSQRVTGGIESAIFIYEPDGGNRKAITTSGYNIMPSWSRDGNRILFSSKIGNEAMEIWVMDADGENKQQITFGTQGRNFTPVESPDGTKIAYSSMQRNVGNPEVWVMDVDGNNQQRLTTTVVLPDQENVWSQHPSWSPDGERIVYASTNSGQTQIWIMNSDGTNQRQITHGLGTDYPDANVPVWSLDGSRITFWAGLERRFGEVWTMNPDGSGARQVTSTLDPSNSDDPHWSPDGTKIIFGMGQGGNRGMYVVPREDGEAVKFAEGVHWCNWQPVRAD